MSKTDLIAKTFHKHKQWHLFAFAWLLVKLLFPFPHYRLIMCCLGLILKRISMAEGSVQFSRFPCTLHKSLYALVCRSETQAYCVV